MTVRDARIWTCDGCDAEVEVEVHVSPSWTPPTGWLAVSPHGGDRVTGDLCLDCLLERNRQYQGGGS